MYVKSRDGRWHAFCYYFDGESGKRVLVRKSTGVRDDGTAASRKRAEIVGAEIERTFAIGGPRRGDPTTIAQAFDKLTAARELARKPQPSIDRGIVSAAQMFKWFGPDKQLATITAVELVTQAAAAIAGGRAHDTVRRDLADLQAAYKLCGIDRPKWPELPKPVARNRWLTAEQCSQLLAAFPPNRRRVLWVMLHTGARKSEVWKLNLALLGQRLLNIVGTKTPKANRWIPTSDELVQVLSEGPLEPWTNIDRDLRREAKKLGFGPISCNDLRRSFATHLAIAGVPILHLMELMGHTSTRMLEQVYAQLGKGQHLADAIDKLPSLGVRTTCQKLDPPAPPKRPRARKN